MLDSYKTHQAVEVCTHCSPSFASSEHMESNYDIGDSSTSTTKAKLLVLPMFLLTSIAFVCLSVIFFIVTERFDERLYFI